MANDTEKTRGSKGAIAKLVACIFAYGVLMGLRSEFEEFWIRTALAGCAGAFLGMALLFARMHWAHRRQLPPVNPDRV